LLFRLRKKGLQNYEHPKKVQTYHQGIKMIELTDENKKNILKLPNQETLMRWMVLKKIPFHLYRDIVDYHKAFHKANE
jgi:hypothetical protein